MNKIVGLEVDAENARAMYRTNPCAETKEMWEVAAKELSEARNWPSQVNALTQKGE